jgi:DNA-binding HxlR family transcriptional regulator
VWWYAGGVDRSPDPHCRAFQSAIDVLARPWTGLILTLLQAGPKRFNELQAAARGVGAKTLSARLKELERKGIIQRHVDPGPPVRVRYSLSARGEGFRQVAGAIERWGRELEQDREREGRGPGNFEGGGARFSP